MGENLVRSGVSSRGFDKWFRWISGAVAVSALVVPVVYLSNPANPEPNQNVPIPDAAWRVATKFILTAVTRKDLHQGYALADPSLRAGASAKEWRNGHPPVVYSNVRRIVKTNWENTNYARPRDVLINVIIVPKDSRAWNAQVGLTKVGHGARAHWLVNSFEPLGAREPTHP